MTRKKIEIRTPQFHRASGDPTPTVPTSFSALRKMNAEALREIGCRKWCDPKDDDWPHSSTLFLFPSEWYQHIPDGFELVDLWGKKFKFESGRTDDDMRGGCLPYGVLKKE